jgi:SSS family transporter
MQFTIIDISIVIIYLIVSAGIGAWIGRHQKNTTDYFLGGRNIPWYAVTFSIIATETSVLTFISVPAISYQGNQTFLQIAIGYILGRILVAFLMVPAYYRGNLSTSYHFLGERFGQKMRNTASITFMVTRILADGVRLFATSIPLTIIIRSSGLFSGLSNHQFYLISILLIGLFTITYTYIGGIKSVVWMDVVQMTIYLLGALLATFLIIRQLPQGLNTIFENPGITDKLRIIYTGFNLSPGDFIQYPYTLLTAVIAGAIFTLASHGTDQLIVQRVLTCRDLRKAQTAMILSGLGVFLQFLLFLFLGILLYGYYNGLGYQDLGLTRADGIFPKFIVEEMPVGISGLIVASLFAAAMSTLSSSLSSLSSASMLDIYLPWVGKNKNDEQLLRISRFMTMIWGVILISAAMIFIGLEGTTVVELALGIASYTYGGILGIFLLGLFNKNVTQRDAIIGFVAAIITMTILIRTIQIAWPLYTVVGSLTAILIGMLSHWLIKTKNRV